MAVQFPFTYTLSGIPADIGEGDQMPAAQGTFQGAVDTFLQTARFGAAPAVQQTAVGYSVSRTSTVIPGTPGTPGTPDRLIYTPNPALTNVLRAGLQKANQRIEIVQSQLDQTLAVSDTISADTVASTVRTLSDTLADDRALANYISSAISGNLQVTSGTVSTLQQMLGVIEDLAITDGEARALAIRAILEQIEGTPGTPGRPGTPDQVIEDGKVAGITLRVTRGDPAVNGVSTSAGGLQGVVLNAALSFGQSRGGVTSFSSFGPFVSFWDNDAGNLNPIPTFRDDSEAVPENLRRTAAQKRADWQRQKVERGQPANSGATPGWYAQDLTRAVVSDINHYSNRIAAWAYSDNRTRWVRRYGERWFGIERLGNFIAQAPEGVSPTGIPRFHENRQVTLFQMPLTPRADPTEGGPQNLYFRWYRKNPDDGFFYFWSPQLRKVIRRQPDGAAFEDVFTIAEGTWHEDLRLLDGKWYCLRTDDSAVYEINESTGAITRVAQFPHEDPWIAWHRAYGQWFAIRGALIGEDREYSRPAEMWRVLDVPEDRGGGQLTQHIINFDPPGRPLAYLEVDDTGVLVGSATLDAHAFELFPLFTGGQILNVGSETIEFEAFGGSAFAAEGRNNPDSLPTLDAYWAFAFDITEEAAGTEGATEAEAVQAPNIATTGGPGRFTMSGLTPKRVYQVQLAGFNGRSFNDVTQSPQFVVRTFGFSGVPTNFRASVTGSSGTITFAPISADGVTRYRILESNEFTGTSLSPNIDDEGTVAAFGRTIPAPDGTGDITTAVTGITPGTPRYIYIRAEGDGALTITRNVVEEDGNPVLDDEGNQETRTLPSNDLDFSAWGVFYIGQPSIDVVRNGRHSVDFAVLPHAGEPLCRIDVWREDSEGNEIEDSRSAVVDATGIVTIAGLTPSTEYKAEVRLSPDSSVVSQPSETLTFTTRA